LIFLFLALRYDYGNDYMGYLNNFNKVVTNDFNISLSYGLDSRELEPGWVLLCWLFKPFGFFSLIAFHSFLFCFIYYSFFKRYIPVNYYWLSVLVFIFNPVFLLIQLSALRQSLAAFIIIHSYQYIERKKLFPFALFVAVAAIFHSSALFFLPAYLLAFFRNRHGNIFGVLLFLLFVGMFIYGGEIISFSSSFIMKNLSKYNTYVIQSDAINFGSGFGLVYNSLLLFLLLFIGKSQKETNLIIFNLSIINFIILPIGAILILATRINYYFQPAILASLPIILNQIKSKPLKYFVLAAIMAYSLKGFYSFLYSETWHASYFTYRTIFSAY
jgi:transmembrane protein EpsG